MGLQRVGHYITTEQQQMTKAWEIHEETKESYTTFFIFIFFKIATYRFYLNKHILF